MPANIPGPAGGSFNAMGMMMNMMRMMNARGGTPSPAMMGSGMQQRTASGVRKKQKMKAKRKKQRRSMRVYSLLPMPGESAHDVDPKELSSVVVKIIQETESSFMRHLDEELVQAEMGKNSDKRNAYRMCPMCKKSVGAFGNNFKNHMRKCCPVCIVLYCSSMYFYCIYIFVKCT